MLPCPVTMAVNFCVTFILNFSLSSILGKNAYVIAPFVVSVHSLCHHLTLCSFFFTHHHTLWYFYVTLLDVLVSCCFFRLLIRHFVSSMSCMRLYPSEFYPPLALFHSLDFSSNLLYEFCVFFCFVVVEV